MLDMFTKNECFRRERERERERERNLSIQIGWNKKNEKQIYTKIKQSVIRKGNWKAFS